ncbi:MULTISPECIES: hypothetical protein [Psychrobacter]|uniref:hypothetical protein n=1 Tax=Psychrobacter TaxID=497 RepID=UPI002119D952|nr:MULTISPECIES: hypothetical protein [Psychrobacter]
MISGIDGLGHMAVQYAIAMGLNVAAVAVGTRLDLQESLNMAAAGKVKATVTAEPLENINDIFERMRQGKIEGRIVIDYTM